MAILKAARQLAVEANVHVHIRKFSVINQARLRNLNMHVITRGPHRLRHHSTSTIDVRCFAQVGAVSIDAKLNCDAFASTHSATSHYDRASFVGLAWRPGGESICCGALHTIRSNLNNGPELQI